MMAHPCQWTVPFQGFHGPIYRFKISLTYFGCASPAGEYIAVKKLENAYVDTDIVEAVWVCGTSTESFLVAVVVPECHRLTSWAQENGLEGSYEELCANDKVRTCYIIASMGHGMS